MSRSSTKLWLIEESPPLNLNTGTDRFGFTGKYPPTGKEVLLQFYGYHKLKQEESKGTSSKRESILLVVEDIAQWWKKSGIGLKTSDAIIYMIKQLIDRYENLKKRKGREGKELENRKQFLDDLQETLWVVNKKVENDLRTSTNPKKLEDWNYLEAIRGKNRKATLGSLDVQERKKIKRKMRQDQSIKRKHALDAPVEQELLLSSSSSEESGEDLHQTFLGELPAKTSKIKTSKKQILTPEVCSLAAKYSMSNRQVFEMVGAASAENSFSNNVLSVNTVRRRRMTFYAEAEKNLLANELAVATDFFTLHWDGKIFKALTHCGNKEERVAVLLTTSGGDEILLGIIPVKNGTASEEHSKILDLLIEKKIELPKIIACVFDTTSVNTGEKNGIVKRLEASLSHALLELACRHHIYELVCNSVSEAVLGKSSSTKNDKKTTAPYEPLFKKLCSVWNDINTNTQNLEMLEIRNLSRTLLRHIEDTKQFLKNWLENETVMRHDYLEVAKLCYVYLGGTLPDKYIPFQLQAPSAYSHARWMSKVLYIMKLAMIKPDFVNDIDSVRSLAVFYSVYYAKAWLTSPFASQAPSYDLAFIKALEEVCSAKGNLPHDFSKIVKSALNKMQDHTWYLSERLVGLAFFDTSVDYSTKEAMRLALLKYKRKPYRKSQQMPQCSSFLNKHLKDFVGPDTYRLFDLLHFNEELIKKPVSNWLASPDYQHIVTVVENLSVVNDCAERALGMATTLYGSTRPQNEKQLQATYKVVDAVRKFQLSTATSSERVTKKTLASFLSSNIGQ